MILLLVLIASIDLLTTLFPDLKDAGYGFADWVNDCFRQFKPNVLSQNSEVAVRSRAALDGVLGRFTNHHTVPDRVPVNRQLMKPGIPTRLPFF